MTELWLVRHGQTDWNLSGRYQGQADIPLNKTGLEQAKLLAEKLRDQTFEAIYSSDLSRAFHTALLIAAGRNVPVRTDPRLREIDQGEWEGQNYKGIVSRYALLAEEFEKHPETWRAPGGESVQEVSERFLKALDDICQTHPCGPVLIVAHGLCLATFYCTVNQISLTEVYLHIPDNANPLHVEWQRTI